MRRLRAHPRLLMRQDQRSRAQSRAYSGAAAAVKGTVVGEILFAGFFGSVKIATAVAWNEI